MARLARVVVAGYPHHITQRGNRRQETFFGSDDYLLAATRYIERNPVRAKIVRKPWRYRYSVTSERPPARRRAIHRQSR